MPRFMRAIHGFLCLLWSWPRFSAGKPGVAETSPAVSNCGHGLSTVMPALVAGIHVLKQRIKQILPIRILRVNETNLPCARPMLDRFLALNSSTNVVVLFEIRFVSSHSVL
jgi:hypothetical protein